MRLRLCISLAAALIAWPAVASAHEPGGFTDEQVDAALGGEVTETASGLYRVDPARGPDFTTHGPDPKPADPAAGHGSGLGPGDPEREPVCADDPATDYSQEVIYAYPLASGNDLGAERARIQASVRRMNAVLNEESLASGGPTADYVVRCEADGSIRVSAVPVSVTGSASFSQVRTAVRAAGFTNPRVDYSIFYDGTGPGGVCGTATLFADDSAGASNRNNNPASTGAGYAVTYPGCWDGATPMHENGHNQGAVQYAAPYSTGSGGHCYDENDVMCYSPDGGDLHQNGTEPRCTDYLHFDCGWDTYFDSAPEPGEWLATHWNIGSSANRFVAFGAPGQNSSPSADFELNCTGLSCAFTDLSADPDGQVTSWAWEFGDGGASGVRHPTHAFPVPGSYQVRLTVTDDDGDQTSRTRQVSVPATTAPPNDAYADAEALSGTGDSATGSNVAATKEAGEPDHVEIAGGDGGASVWYRWRAPADGLATVATCGSDFDTLLAVYKAAGNAASASRVASNDDSTAGRCPATRQSELSFAATGGTAYAVAVDGFDRPQTSADDPDEGAVALAIELSVPPAPPSETTPEPHPVIPPQAGGEGDLEPIVPTVNRPRILHRGITLDVTSSGPGSVHPFRIPVPARARNLRVVLDGAACVSCERGLDLALTSPRHARRDLISCTRADLGWGETCRVARPGRGRWHADVVNVDAPDGAEFTIRADFAKRGRKRR